jgi:hypothetical protein
LGLGFDLGLTRGSLGADGALLTQSSLGMTGPHLCSRPSQDHPNHQLSHGACFAGAGWNLPGSWLGADRGPPAEWDQSSRESGGTRSGLWGEWQHKVGVRRAQRRVAGPGQISGLSGMAGWGQGSRETSSLGSGSRGQQQCAEVPCALVPPGHRPARATTRKGAAVCGDTLLSTAHWNVPRVCLRRGDCSCRRLPDGGRRRD